MTRRRRLAFVVLPLAAYWFGATAVEKHRLATSATTPDPGRADAATVDRDRLMLDLQTLAAPALEGRLTGSAGNYKAQTYIVSRFRQIGVKPIVPTLAGPVYDQHFGFTHHSIRGLVTPGRPYARTFPNATNLVGEIEGTAEPDRFIALTAHYDHLGVRGGEIYPGADDNASGVAAMLAAADHFVVHRPRRSLIVVAFDGEEEGLRGSQFFVAHSPVPLDRIAIDVNLDMVGRGDTNELVVSGTYFAPALVAPLADIARGHRLRLLFGHDRPLYRAAGLDDWTHESDHGPFHDAGIPFLYFGVEDHADYHRPTDTADKIPREFFADAASLIVDVVRRLDSARALDFGRRQRQ